MSGKWACGGLEFVNRERVKINFRNNGKWNKWLPFSPCSNQGYFISSHNCLKASNKFIWFHWTFQPKQQTMTWRVKCSQPHLTVLQYWCLHLIFNTQLTIRFKHISCLTAHSVEMCKHAWDVFVTAYLLVHYIQRSLVIFQTTSSKLSRPNSIKFPPQTLLCVATIAVSSFYLLVLHST